MGYDKTKPCSTINIFYFNHKNRNSHNGTYLQEHHNIGTTAFESILENKEILKNELSQQKHISCLNMD